MLGGLSRLCSPPVLSLVAGLRGCSPIMLRRRQLKNVTNDGTVVTSLDSLFHSLTVRRTNLYFCRFFFLFLLIPFFTWRPVLEIKCVVRWRESSGPYSLLWRVSGAAGTGQTFFLGSWWFLHSSRETVKKHFLFWLSVCVCLFVSITGYSLLRAPPREWIFACTAVCTPASRAVVLRLRGGACGVCICSRHW